MRTTEGGRPYEGFMIVCSNNDRPYKYKRAFLYESYKFII
jgi:hypothetical protein